jgi:DNA-binding CsgD family transcriptional regulator
MHEYALEQLERSAESTPIRSAHADYFLLLAEAAQPDLRGPPSVLWLDRLEAEHDNIRGVVRWALETRNAALALRLGSALQRYLDARGHAGEGRRWLEAALALDAPAPAAVRARALHVAGRLAWLHGDYAIAKAHHQESMSLYESIRDQSGVALAIQYLGNVAHYELDYARAADLYKWSLALYRDLGDDQGTAAVVNSLGVLARNRGELESAFSLLSESLAIFRRLEDSRNVALLLNNLARVARDRGDYPQATDLCTESLALFNELEDAWGVATVLVNLGIVGYLCADLRRAARLFGAAESLREASTGSPYLSVSPEEFARYEAAARATRLGLGEQAFAAQWAGGRRLSLAEAVAAGLGRAHPATGRPNTAAAPDRGLLPGGLTPREWQVAQLVAKGMPNREIAEKLIITLATTDRHVANILAKLNMHSRAQLAVWAADHARLR